MMFKQLPKEVKLYLLSFFKNPELSAFSRTNKENETLVNLIYQHKINRMFHIAYESQTAKKDYHRLCKQLNRVIHHIVCRYIIFPITESMEYRRKFDLYHRQMTEILMDNRYDALCELIDEENIPTQSEESYQAEKKLLEKSDLLVKFFCHCINLNKAFLFSFLLKKDETILDKIYQNNPLKSRLLTSAIEKNNPFWVDFFLQRKADVNIEENDDSFTRKPLSYAIHKLIHHTPGNLSETKEIIQLLLKANADPFEKSLLTNQRALTDYCDEQLNNVNADVQNILNLIIEYQFTIEPERKKIKYY